MPSLPKEFKLTLHRRSLFKPTFHLFLRVLLHFSILFGVFFSYNRGYFVLFGILIFLNGFFTTFLGWAGAGHEYFHGTAFSGKRTNRALFRIFSCATWNNWGWFEVSHILHHKFTLHAMDPEGPSKKGFAVARILWMSTVDMPTFVIRLKILCLNLFGVAPIKDEKLKEVMQNKPNFQKRISVGAFSVFIYQFTMFYILSRLNLFVAFVILLAPFTFTLVNKILEVNQHIQMKAHSVDFRENSRTFRYNSLLEFLYSNMNFHSEHHMFPGVPYYRLPKLNQFLQAEEEVQIPPKGLIQATKIALSSQVNSTQQLDCLQCPVKCANILDRTLESRSIQASD